MCRTRLDIRGGYPSGMEEYLDTYGWHFSKKLCRYAVGRMRKKNSRTGAYEPIEFWDLDKTNEFLRRFNVDTSGFIGYDAVYVVHMARADYYGSSIADEPHLALFVKDFLDDPDGYSEVAMTRYYSDCIGKGEMPPWEDVI